MTTRIISARISTDEYDNITVLARRENRTKSNMAAVLLLEALAARKCPRRLIDPRESYAVGTVYPVEEPGTPPGGEGE
jgi:hypothetical protein